MMNPSRKAGLLVAVSSCVVALLATPTLAATGCWVPEDTPPTVGHVAGTAGTIDYSLHLGEAQRVTLTHLVEAESARAIGQAVWILRADGSVVTAFSYFTSRRFGSSGHVEANSDEVANVNFGDPQASTELGQCGEVALTLGEGDYRVIAVSSGLGDEAGVNRVLDVYADGDASGVVASTGDSFMAFDDDLDGGVVARADRFDDPRVGAHVSVGAAFDASAEEMFAMFLAIPATAVHAPNILEVSGPRESVCFESCVVTAGPAGAYRFRVVSSVEVSDSPGGPLALIGAGRATRL